MPHDDDIFFRELGSFIKRFPAKSITLIFSSIAFLLGIGWSASKLLTPPSNIRERAAIEDAYRKHNMPIPNQGDIVGLIQSFSDELIKTKNIYSIKAIKPQANRQIINIDKNDINKPIIKSDPIEIHRKAKELSKDRPDSLFGSFIVTLFPKKEILNRKCQGLQLFSEINADIYLEMDNLLERIIQIDRRIGSHYSSTGIEVSDKTQVIIEFTGDAVYEPFVIQRSIATIVNRIEDSGECSIYLNIFSSDIKLKERQDKDVGVIPDLFTFLLEDQTQYYRVRAAKYLGAIGDYSATQTLIKAMVNEKDSYVQACIAYSLGELGDVTSIQELENVYEQYDQKPSYGSMFEAALKKLHEKK